MRPRTGEERTFAAPLAVVGLHLLIVAVSQDGQGLAASAAEALLAIALTAGMIVLFLVCGRAARAILAGAVGAAATGVGIAAHVGHVVMGGGEVSDYTGLLLTLAGFVLLGLAFRIAFRGRRRRIKLLAVPLVLVIVQWVVVPAVGAGVATTVPRATIARAPTLGVPGARDVTFQSNDGVRLAGWYTPGRNGAAVILTHGSHGDRTDTLAHLRILARAGYAVLAYDARGHGDSGGQTNALGWRGADDVAGAVAFLRRQPGIDPRRIAMLGLSMGAEEALRAAAQGVGLRAIVADGAGASTMGDRELTPAGPLAAVATSVTWLSMRLIELLSGEDEPAPLKDIVNDIATPVLLIASNRAGERTIDRAFRERIGRNANLWYVSDAGHTKALQAHPRAYAERITTFLHAALTGLLVPPR